MVVFESVGAGVEAVGAGVTGGLESAGGVTIGAVSTGAGSTTGVGAGAGVVGFESTVDCVGVTVGFESVIVVEAVIDGAVIGAFAFESAVVEAVEVVVELEFASPAVAPVGAKEGLLEFVWKLLFGIWIFGCVEVAAVVQEPSVLSKLPLVILTQ